MKKPLSEIVSGIEANALGSGRTEFVRIDTATLERLCEAFRVAACIVEDAKAICEAQGYKSTRRLLEAWDRTTAGGEDEPK